MERGVSAAEIEASSAFYAPVPSVRVVAGRVVRDAEAREAIESSAENNIHGSSLRRRVAAKMRNAAKKLYATTEAGRQAGGTKGEESGKLLKGDEPLFVLGVTEEAENETLALLQRYASKLGAEGTECRKAGLDADVALAKYAAALASQRGLSVDEVKQKAAGKIDTVADNIAGEDLLHRLRHQAVVLLVEERRAGSKNVEKGSAASLMQSAVDHFARSFRLALRCGQKSGGANKRDPSPVKVAAATAQKQATSVEE